MDRGRRVALAFIVGDSYRQDELRRMLESVGPHIGGAFASYNGKKDRPPAARWRKWAGVPVHYRKTAWEDDFAAARNHSFSIVPKDQFDWILWLDTDDVFRAPDGLDPVFDSLDEYTRGVFLRYDYAIEPESGQVVVQQWRERLMSTDWPWMWQHPIHENCIGPVGTQFARREDAWVEHLRQSGEDRGARERNRRIIAKHRREQPDNPRYMYYFANETMAEAADTEPGIERDTLCDAAISEYRRYLTLMASQQTDEVYSAGIRIADLYAMKGDHNAAIDAYLQAIKFYPNWPDAYVGIAKEFMEVGDYPRMREFADMATRYSKPITSAAIEPMSSSFHPVFLRGIANEEMGNLDEALQDYLVARGRWNPPQGELDRKIEELRSRLEPVPEKETVNIRKLMRGSQPEKSICFFTNPIAEEWNWDTLADGGHGGSETMVLEMAPRFATDGWRVAVFGMPGDAHGLNDNGVEMYNHNEWLPNERFRVFVSSRALEPFSAPINADVKLLWMHDVNAGPAFNDYKDLPDRILGVSKWHCGYVSNLYDMDPARFRVVPNGIDISMYPETEFSAVEPKFVYSSSPDRGLEELLAMWPIIKGNHPDATLEILYGWEYIDKLLAAGFSPFYLGALKDRIIRAIDTMGGEQGGIFWRGRVPPTEVARTMQRSSIWAYPTQFMETFCLTAVQAQAAGVLPITSQLAALNETVSCPWYTLRGWPKNADYQSRFLGLIERALSAEEQPRVAEALAMGRRLAGRYTLEASYAKWNGVLASLGVE